jgi:hypothetical protein
MGIKLFYASRRSHGHKECENGAKTTKLRLIEGARTKLQRILKNLGLDVTKGPNCKELNTAEGFFVKSGKAQGVFCKKAKPCRFDSAWI